MTKNKNKFFEFGIKKKKIHNFETQVFYKLGKYNFLFDNKILFYKNLKKKMNSNENFFKQKKNNNDYIFFSKENFNLKKKIFREEK